MPDADDDWEYNWQRRDPSMHVEFNQGTVATNKKLESCLVCVANRRSPKGGYRCTAGIAGYPNKNKDTCILWGKRQTLITARAR